MKFIRVALPLMLAALTGCATHSPQSCDANTWQERGYAHAMNGQPVASEESGKTCFSDSAPEAYQAGFDDGLKNYCSFKRGMWAGEHGQEPTSRCADPEWDEYQTGYLTGLKIFNVNSRLEAISKQLESARSDLWALEAAGRHATSSSIKAQQARIDQLKREREQASRHLMNLRADVNRP